MANPPTPPPAYNPASAGVSTPAATTTTETVTASDQAAQAANAQAAAAASAQPVSTQGAASASGTQGSGATSVFTVSGPIPIGVPSSLNDKTYDESIGGTPATPAGHGKGSTRPDLSRISDLFKTAAAAAQGADNGGVGLNPDVLNDIATQIGGKMGAAIKQQTPGTWVWNTGMQRAVLQQAYKDILDHVHKMGTGPSNPELENVPNIHNGLTQLRMLGQTVLPAHTIDRLDRQGFDTKGVTHLAQLVRGSDQLAGQLVTGSPGTAKKPGTPATSAEIPATQVYQDFYNKWQANQNGYQQSIMSSLSAAGLLDISPGTPVTGQEVGAAYQQLLADTPAGTSPDTYLGQRVSATVGSHSQYYDFVNQLVTQAGATNISQAQIQALANMYQTDIANGTPSTDADVQYQISQLYDHNAAGSINAQTHGGNDAQEGYAAAAENSITQLAGQYGVALSAPQLAAMVKQVLANGQSSIYQVQDQAADTATAYMKNAIATAHPGIAPLINSGVVTQDIANPYLALASSTLGIPESDMALNDPSGKWMAWTSGGSGPNGTKTLAEARQQYMTDPTYGYATSAPARATYAEGANAILGLFGKLPQSAQGAFSGASGTMPTS